MDPNAALAEIRDLVKYENENRALDRDDSLRLAELFDSLDIWLTRGGFLPDVWIHGGSDGSHQTR